MPTSFRHRPVLAAVLAGAGALMAGAVQAQEAAAPVAAPSAGPGVAQGMAQGAAQGVPDAAAALASLPHDLSPWACS